MQVRAQVKIENKSPKLKTRVQNKSTKYKTKTSSKVKVQDRKIEVQVPNQKYFKSETSEYFSWLRKGTGIAERICSRCL